MDVLSRGSKVWSLCFIGKTNAHLHAVKLRVNASIDHNVLKPIIFTTLKIQFFGPD